MLQGLVLCRKTQIHKLCATYHKTVPTFAASDFALPVMSLHPVGQPARNVHLSFLGNVPVQQMANFQSSHRQRVQETSGTIRFAVLHEDSETVLAKASDWPFG